MRTLRKIIFAAAIIANANAQWQSSRMPSRARRNQYEATQKAPSQELSTQWGSNYETRDQWSNIKSGNPQQWNDNLQRQNPYQRQSNLVDYPFTVEFVNRRRQQVSGGTPPTVRKGVRPFLNSQDDDENLIDYPFTVEYASNMNYPSENQENMPQASLHRNQESFQLKTQQQRYRRNHHHFSANHNYGDPRPKSSW